MSRSKRSHEYSERVCRYAPLCLLWPVCLILSKNWQKKRFVRISFFCVDIWMAPRTGLEPVTHWLTASCSTTELSRNMVCVSRTWEIYKIPRKSQNFFRKLSLIWGIIPHHSIGYSPFFDGVFDCFFSGIERGLISLDFDKYDFSYFSSVW